MIHDLTAIDDDVRRDPSAGTETLLAGARADSAGFDELVDNLRQQYSAQRRRALLGALSAHEAANDASKAIDTARALAAAEPLSEDAACRVMRLLYRYGDRAGALSAFETIRLRLAADTGLPPGSATAELARQIEVAASEIPRCPPDLSVFFDRPPRTVGRDLIWSELVRRWRNRETVVLVGEAGLGKTRLIQDLCAVDAGVLRVRGIQSAHDAPFGLVARLLRDGVRCFGVPPAGEQVAELARWLPELGAPPTRSLDGGRLELALQAALEYWHGAGLTGVALDDFHHADAASSNALLSVERVTSELSSLGWVLCVRPRPVVPQLEAEFADSGATRKVLRLDPLEADGIETLLESLALAMPQRRAWAEALLRHTGGNPMFVLETVRALAAGGQRVFDAAPMSLPVPTHIGELIAVRMRGLSAEARQLLQVAAIAGDDYCAGLAAAVIGATPLSLASGWRELELSQVVDPNGIAHDLWLDVAAGQVPRPIRIELHRQIAAWLEANGTGTPPGIAAHWTAGNAPARAAHQWRQAARDATKLSRHADAVRYFVCAVAAFDECGAHDDAFDVVHESVTPVLMAVGADAGEAQINRLERDAVTDDQRLRALMVRSQLEVFVGRAAGCVAAAEAATDLARTLQRADQLIDASIMYAQGLALLGRPRDALGVLDEARAHGHASAGIRRQYDYYAARGYVLDAMQQRSEAIAALEHALSLARALEDRSEQVTILTNLAVEHGYLGDAERAAELTETARRIHGQLGPAVGVPAVNDLNLAGHWFSLGRYAEALQLLTETIESFRSTKSHLWLAMAESTTALLWLRLGEFERARRTLSSLPSDMPPFVRAGRALVQQRIDSATGATSMSALYDIASELGDGNSTALVAIRIELQLARADSPQDGLQRCRRAALRATECEYRAGIAFARVIEAECQLELGGTSAAAEAARAAHGMLAAVRHHEFDPAYCSLVTARCLRASGDEAGAKDVIRAAVHQLRSTAVQHVPRPYQRSFLHRNPIHAELLAMAGRSPS